ncbi:hypothetical protein L596_004178 [Steinernema carpocapsae]|uniref:Uncharacterized protein n=1 Tax=Steinernema carpocapsae TaxID=34508 RepID=A0A4U8UUX3_STECR|nr:hypothetical protein L596_004178 [Steinernema carpocapsae]
MRFPIDSLLYGFEEPSSKKLWSNRLRLCASHASYERIRCRLDQVALPDMSDERESLIQIPETVKTTKRLQSRVAHNSLFA